MQLPRAGREYLRITLADVPVGAIVEVSFDDGATWLPTTGSGTDYQILIAGPDFPSPGAATVVPDNRPRVRITDDPEVVIRSAVDAIRLIA